MIFFQHFFNLGMFRFFSTYGINSKLGYRYVDDILKLSRKLKTGNIFLETLNVTNSDSEKCKVSTDCM